ncbi:MAG: hypothetical protein HY438_01975 [DPANN group archaeon]|nr:hypothetical protein [DPANN group archaeon]
MTKQDLAYEIARINIFSDRPDVHVELVHMVLDSEGGARHVIPELQKAFANWQASRQICSPQAVGLYIVQAHPEAYNPSGSITTQEGQTFFVGTGGLPHWIYNVYISKGAKQHKEVWELEIHRSKSAIKTEFYCVGTRRGLEKWGQRAVMFLEGRVTRLLYRI